MDATRGTASVLLSAVNPHVDRIPSLRHPMERPTAPRQPFTELHEGGLRGVCFHSEASMCAWGEGNSPESRAARDLTGTGRCWTRMCGAGSQV